MWSWCLGALFGVDPSGLGQALDWVILKISPNQMFSVKSVHTVMMVVLGDVIGFVTDRNAKGKIAYSRQVLTILQL